MQQRSDIPHRHVARGASPRIALATVLALVATSCAPMSRQSKAVFAAGSIGLLAVGAATMTTAVSDDDAPWDELSCSLLISPCGIGMLMVFAGAAGLVRVMATPTTDEPTSRSALAVASPRPAPSQLAPGALEREHRAPPHTLRPLPEVATDATTMQFAKQARNHALHGRCDLARSAALQVQLRDPAYLRALIDAGVIAPC